VTRGTQAGARANTGKLLWKLPAGVHNGHDGLLTGYAEPTAHPKKGPVTAGG